MKKILSALLCLMLCLALFVSCQTPAQTPATGEGKPSGSQQATTQESTQPETSQPESTQPAVPLTPAEALLAAVGKTFANGVDLTLAVKQEDTTLISLPLQVTQDGKVASQVTVEGNAISLYREGTNNYVSVTAQGQSMKIKLTDDQLAAAAGNGDIIDLPDMDLEMDDNALQVLQTFVQGLPAKITQEQVADAQKFSLALTEADLTALAVAISGVPAEDITGLGGIGLEAQVLVNAQGYISQLSVSLSISVEGESMVFSLVAAVNRPGQAVQINAPTDLDTYLPFSEDMFPSGSGSSGLVDGGVMDNVPGDEF